MTTLLTVRQTRERWSTSAAFVYALVRKGHLNALNLTPSASRPTLRIPLEQVENFERRQSWPNAPAQDASGE